MNATSMFWPSASSPRSVDAPSATTSPAPTTSLQLPATAPVAEADVLPTASSLKELTLMTTVPPGHHSAASPHLITEVASAQREHHPLPMTTQRDTDSPDVLAATALPEPDDLPSPDTSGAYEGTDTDTVRLPPRLVAEAVAAANAASTTATDGAAGASASTDGGQEEVRDDGHMCPKRRSGTLPLTQARTGEGGEGRRGLQIRQEDRKALEAMGISSARLSKLVRGWEDPNKKKGKKKPASDLSHLFEAGKAVPAPSATQAANAAAAAPAKPLDELASLAAEDDFDFDLKSEVRRRA